MSLDTSAAPLGARNATLTDLAVLLREQQARKVDVVASSAAIRARHGQLVVDGTALPTEPDEDRWARWLAEEMCPTETNRDRLAGCSASTVSR